MASIEWIASLHFLNVRHTVYKMGSKLILWFVKRFAYIVWNNQKGQVDFFKVSGKQGFYSKVVWSMLKHVHGFRIGSSKMTSKEAEGYHLKQISIFAEQTEADLVTAFTINYVEEAIGIVKVWKKQAMITLQGKSKPG